MAETVSRTTKRLRELDSQELHDPSSLSLAAAKKRRSRFEADEDTTTSSLDADKIQQAISSVSARAAQMTKDLAGKVSSLSSGVIGQGIAGNTPLLSFQTLGANSAADKMAQAAEMQKQLAAQMASVSSMLSLVNKQKSKGDRKAAYRPLLLDEQGRQVDELGNVVKTDVQQVKTIAANVTELKKKDNPYLTSAVVEEELPMDDRLVLSSRSLRAKKALKFVEAGHTHTN